MKSLVRRGAALLAFLAVLPAEALTLGVTEGVTYRATDKEIAARFEGIAEALAKSLRQPVNVQVISTYTEMRQALKNGSIDIAYIHPAHLALEAAKSGAWRTSAWTAGFTEYKVAFLCRDAQPISDWKAIAGKKLVTPDADSITAWMTRAVLRENGVAPGQIKTLVTRYQDAVPFYVENTFADYGATASRGVIKEWQAKGGKVCAESRPVPIKIWITSTRLDASVTANIRETLLGLSGTEPGRKALAASTYKGLVAPSMETEKTLTAWLGL